MTDAQQTALLADEHFTLLTPDEVAELVNDDVDPRVIEAMIQYDGLMEAVDLVLHTLRLRGADPLVLAYLDTAFDSFIDPCPPPVAQYSHAFYQEAKAYMDQEAAGRISRLQLTVDATWPGRRLEEVVSRVSYESQPA